MMDVTVRTRNLTLVELSWEELKLVSEVASTLSHINKGTYIKRIRDHHWLQSYVLNGFVVVEESRWVTKLAILLKWQAWKR